MKHMLRNKVALVWAAVSLFGTGIAHAGTAPIDFPNPLGASCTDLTCAISKIIDFLWAVGVPLASIMVVWAAFQMMTAAGDPEKFGKGRKTIIYAAIGLAVLLLSKGVASIIRSILGG